MEETPNPEVVVSRGSNHLGLGKALYERKDFEEAAQHFEQCIEENVDAVEASYYLGKMYRHGEGVPVNPSLALEYLESAHNNGYDKAKNALTSLKLWMEKEQAERPRINVTIPETRTRGEGKEKWTAFVFQIECDGFQWHIEKRYSFCYNFYCTLRSTFPKQTHGVPFPPKKVLNNMDPSFIENRRLQLENFIQEMTRRAPVNSSVALLSFLEVDDHVRRA
eukprot:TRINITY_DN12442_c0_g1_i1.p1 TRINITY_DN12442_c0_g1~~TRINITY_DN12442_c0_g1_i1.p1  ORF type:complete len:243 (-),score=90.02 TRINITY_DN12442_c0_g1_i1:252-914(-)